MRGGAIYYYCFLVSKHQQQQQKQFCFKGVSPACLFPQTFSMGSLFSTLLYGFPFLLVVRCGEPYDLFFRCFWLLKLM